MAAENSQPGANSGTPPNRRAEYFYKGGIIDDRVGRMTPTDYSVQFERTLGPFSDHLLMQATDFERRYNHLTRYCTSESLDILRKEGNGVSLASQVTPNSQRDIGYALPLPKNPEEEKSEKYLILLGANNRRKVLVIEAGYTKGPARRLNELFSQHNNRVIVGEEGNDPLTNIDKRFSGIGAPVLLSSENESDFPALEEAIFNAMTLAEQRNINKRREARKQKIESEVSDWLASIAVFEKAMAARDY